MAETVRFACPACGRRLQGDRRHGERKPATAYVKQPDEGQTATLPLPEGLCLADGYRPTQQVQVSMDLSQVSWRVRVLQEGMHGIRVSLNNGASQSKEVEVAESRR